MTTIRKAVAEDAKRLTGIYKAAIRELAKDCYTCEQREAWASGVDAEKFSARVATGNVHVAEIDGEIAGFGQIDLSDGLVDMIFISPEHAGKGVGAQLMRHMERLAIDVGLRSLHLRGSLNAVPFYEKMGYRKTERIVHRMEIGVEFICVNMEKVLKS